MRIAFKINHASDLRFVDTNDIFLITPTRLIRDLLASVTTAYSSTSCRVELAFVSDKIDCEKINWRANGTSPYNTLAASTTVVETDLC